MGLTVLIVSTDAIIGALLALHAEVHGYRAVVAEDDETPNTAVARCSPRIILVDLDRSDAFSPTFVAQQRAAGRCVIAFSPKRLAAEVRAQAEGFSLQFFAMPVDVTGFKTMLDDAATSVRGSINDKAEGPEVRA